MKRLLILFAFLALNFVVVAGQLVIIPTGTAGQAQQLIQNPLVKVHLVKDGFLIATIGTDLKENFVVLDDKAFADESDYFLIYCPKKDQQGYLQGISSDSRVLFSNDDFIILKYDNSENEILKPFHNDGMVRIMNTQARLPKAMNQNKRRALDPDPEVVAMIQEVSGTNLTTSVQHLEDYGTRNCYTPESVEAQIWIAQQFEDLGLSVEIMDFAMSGSASDNVIATKTGSVYPEEYVICGSHYDSYANGGGAPGADDNASGSAAVLEMARILSQYTFDRTIIFCTFSGEEYGLYGSEAYASRCAEEGMNILGYFNLDMIGYLQNGSPVHTDVIYPASAQELYDFYFDVCAVYLPDFPIEPGSLSGGDSDHTSFNNNGFMGIFPFEDSQDYSPYIHTPNDLVGLSYNHEAQAVMFTQASLASVVTMANLLMPPQNLVALAGDETVELNWSPMPVASIFNIYRDNILIGNADADATSYTDNTVVNETQYAYYITAIYSDSGEESDPSNIVTATPMPPLSFPLVIDFENGTPYWEFDQGWGLSTEASHSSSHSLTESPTGEYTDNEESQAVLRSFDLDFGYTTAQLSFWNKFNLESGYDYMYFEITTDGSNWTILETFNGNQNSWQLQTYSLDDYLGEPYVQVRFRFTSDSGVTEEGMFIDDFEITVEGGYQMQTLDLPEGWSSISSYLAPYDPALDEVFSSLGNTLLAVQTMDGSYIPLDLINTIGEWNAGEGYKIKLANPATLQIVGNPSGISSIEVSEGWNLIPVLSECDLAAGEFLSLNQTVEIIKEVAGNGVYWEEEGLTGLTTLETGKAYMVKLSESSTLTFPDCTRSLIPEKQVAANDYVATGNSHLIVIPPGVAYFCEPGDKILAVNTSGLCTGSLTIENTNDSHAMLFFGNDSLTSDIDGMMENEHLMMVWLDSQSIYHQLTGLYDLSYPDENWYVDEGVSKVYDLSPDVLGQKEIETRLLIWPNPATNHVRIILNENVGRMVTFSATDGRIILNRFVEKESIIDLTGFAKGIYTISIQSDKGLIAKKLIVK
ncbi:MAG: M28 family peptidase [Bacteroidales bacterium]|nr:M28 family peptidase [Bacteroidales bacterium]